MHTSSWRRAVLGNCLAVGLVVLVVLTLGFAGARYQDLVWVGRAPRPPRSGPDSRPGTAASRSRSAGCTPSGLVRSAGTDQPSPILSPFLLGPVAPASAPARPGQHVLRDLHQAVDVMRAEYFGPGVGTWPAAIDWTAAVAQTVMSAVLQTYVGAGEHERARALFVETVAAYFGQDYIAIRGQAFDDMLWVVLGWIEAIRSVDAATTDRLAQSLSPALSPPSFLLPFSYMAEWVPAFAHRARLFWDLASRGWDTVLCGGGMVWDPALMPYKNSITNELWIAASAAMYRYFPGDNDTAPFVRTAGSALAIQNPRHLEAAVSGYHWLTSEVNMTNRHGLYIDGYHVAGWDSGGTACDLADNTVFTYNQGVLLTGQRHLWAATGDRRYLEDGHRLIQAVVAATGWDLGAQEPVGDGSGGETPAPWHGLGRGGVIEELCDDSATCSQDGQIFKGIFFHHLAEFCAPLRPRSEPEPEPESEAGAEAGPEVREGHLAACRAYVPWVGHNAGAALRTRDGRGRAGMWWGVPPGAAAGGRDPNDRGRGRTVETQTGLVAVLRAYYELLPRPGSGTDCGP